MDTKNLQRSKPVDKVFLDTDDLAWKRVREDSLFGQLPEEYPYYVLIQYGAVPYQYRLEARYSDQLRIGLEWDIDGFKDESHIEIDRTKWKGGSFHDFHLGYLKNRFALLDRQRFISEFEKITRLPFTIIEEQVKK